MNYPDKSTKNRNKIGNLKTNESSNILIQSRYIRKSDETNRILLRRYSLNILTTKRGSISAQNQVPLKKKSKSILRIFSPDSESKEKTKYCIQDYVEQESENLLTVNQGLVDKTLKTKTKEMNECFSVKSGDNSHYSNGDKTLEKCESKLETDNPSLEKNLSGFSGVNKDFQLTNLIKNDEILVDENLTRLGSRNENIIGDSCQNNGTKRKKNQKKNIRCPSSSSISSTNSSCIDLDNNNPLRTNSRHLVKDFLFPNSTTLPTQESEALKIVHDHPPKVDFYNEHSMKSPNSSILLEKVETEFLW